MHRAKINLLSRIGPHYKADEYFKDGGLKSETWIFERNRFFQYNMPA